MAGVGYVLPTRVLIVEDDADSCEVLSRLLRRHGYVAECVGTANEALAKLANEPSCVLLDLRLPDDSGLAVLQRVRDDNLPVRVAVVTGDGDGNLLADAILLRPDAFFTKPVDLTEVLSWLATASTGGGRWPHVESFGYVFG